MSLQHRLGGSVGILSCVVGALLAGPLFQASPARGQEPSLGTFAPTPYIMVGGAAPTSFGYSPLGRYGDASMALNGPFSPMRSISAPVRVYSRGYDGVLHEETATSFSNPNLPTLSPFVYPTQSNYYYAPRVNRTPPWWDRGANWIDHR